MKIYLVMSLLILAAFGVGLFAGVMVHARMVHAHRTGVLRA